MTKTEIKIPASKLVYFLEADLSMLFSSSFVKLNKIDNLVATYWTQFLYCLLFEDFATLLAHALMAARVEDYLFGICHTNDALVCGLLSWLDIEYFDL